MSKFDFLSILQKVEQTKKELPKKLANVTQNYFVLSFRKQGFDGGKWQEVKRRIPGTPEFKYPKTKGLSRRTKPILIESGELRRRVANSILLATWPTVKLMVDLPQAAAINEGLGNMPKRQFIGQSNELTEKQIRLVEGYFDKIWEAGNL